MKWILLGKEELAALRVSGRLFMELEEIAEERGKRHWPTAVPNKQTLMAVSKEDTKIIGLY